MHIVSIARLNEFLTHLKEMFATKEEAEALAEMIISGKAFAPAEISSGELLATSNNEVIVFEWPIGCQC